LNFDLAKAGNNIAARIAMIAMTTNSSISVNADRTDDEILSPIFTKSQNFPNLFKGCNCHSP
jgi:hypothetical protein